MVDINTKIMFSIYQVRNILSLSENIRDTNVTNRKLMWGDMFIIMCMFNNLTSDEI